MNDMTITPAVPVASASDGEARWWWGWLAVIKLTGEQTDGRLTVVELTIPPERMCPPHVHHREHETFLVSAGRLTVQIGEQTVEAGPGEMIVAPPEIPHRFTAGPDGATVLMLLTPAGLEGLIREQSVPATSRALPPPDALPAPDLNRMREIAVRYGCELLA
jgi:quercetin dioxygenase-like cupin family protein